MSTDMIVSSWQGNQVRSFNIDGEPWFVGKDVAVALGYTNTNAAISRHCDGVRQTYPIQTPRGIQQLRIIDEADLYALIFGAEIKLAKNFKRWVTNEVLPSIRKHGAYITTVKLEEMLADPDNAIKLFTALKEEKEARKALEKMAKEDAPKVKFADVVISGQRTYTIGEAAKLISNNCSRKIGRNRLMAFLRRTNVLMQHTNEPYQRWINRGYFVVELHQVGSDFCKRVVKQSKLTGLGLTKLAPAVTKAIEDGKFDKTA